LALKSARIVDSSSKSSGFADFENTVDRESAVNFGTNPDSACLDVRIKKLGSCCHRSFFILSRYVNEFIQIISFFQRSSFKQSLELYCVIVIKHVAFFTICAKLTMAFAFTNLPLNSVTPLFPDVVVVSDLNKNIGGSTDLAQKGTDRQICIPLFTPL